MKVWLMCLSSFITLSACAADRAAPPHQPQAEVHVPSASEIFQNEDASYKTTLSQLQQRNPIQEAQAAIQRGERYFYCNAGRSNTIPGITAQTYASLPARCEVRCLEGVTDALLGPHHHAYLSAALAFSARWNQIMLLACR
ncbi:hypothetical protein [Thiolinea disciformis]|uniref:hypothetical protein n=1 Tax=Thiolinea disciformis TaxID=125614 RepID=UPI00036D6B5C|nr:hypothetical protein [Thiolinea disciformis]